MYDFILHVIIYVCHGTPPPPKNQPLCMLALGKTGEGAYTWDHYIPSDDHYLVPNAVWARDICAVLSLAVMGKTREKQQK